LYVASLFLNSDVANGKGGVWGGIFHLPPLFVLGKLGADNTNTVYYNLEYNTMEYYNLYI